jgi:hypothetical protein
VIYKMSTEAIEQSVQKIAIRVHSAGLTTPFLLMLHSVGPFRGMLGTFLEGFEPFLRLLCGERSISMAKELLAAPDSVEKIEQELLKREKSCE